MSAHFEAALPPRQCATCDAQRETVCALDDSRLALTDMALAARPSAEPRTACPVCGGPIHPIAGKCKHCKTDLVKLRKLQQAAAATPTAASRNPYARPSTAPVLPINGSNGSATAHPPAPVIIAPPVAATDPYVMSLPPVPRGAWSRSWPVVVAVIAGAAIVVSVILLLTGGDRNKNNPQQKVIPDPAADHMDTDPLPAPSNDPWKGANPPGGSAVTPPAAPAPPTPAPPPSPAPSHASAPPPEKWQSSMMQAACARFTTCGILDSSAKEVCDQLSAAAAFADTDTRDRVAHGDCTYDQDKAVACLAGIDRFPCGQGQADFATTLLGITDCTDVLSCH
jgi:hypothetical protein